MSNPLQFGNRELSLADFTRLASIAGPVGKEYFDPDAIYLKFERETYTRQEVFDLCRIIGNIQPDECEASDGDLRLWWD